MYTLRPYVAADAPAWDALVARSRNGNFLHRRGYMDYHADRFDDASVVVERDGEVAAVFPANRRGTDVVSHAGLTYGGLIVGDDLRAGGTLDVFTAMADHYREAGVEQIVYKAVPHVFHRYPAEEDLYALHRLGARVVRRDISSVIPLGADRRVTAGRKGDVAKARRAGIRVGIGDDLAPFHALLESTLARHAAVPTHSLAELVLLRSRFPQSIVLHEARGDDQLLAAVLVYDFGRVVHTQYMASSEDGRRLGALSLLLAELIERIYATRSHLTFGISTEDGGRVLNAGLVAQKESFGARGVVHDVYGWTL